MGSGFFSHSIHTALFGINTDIHTFYFTEMLVVGQCQYMRRMFVLYPMYVDMYHQQDEQIYNNMNKYISLRSIIISPTTRSASESVKQIKIQWLSSSVYHTLFTLQIAFHSL